MAFPCCKPLPSRPTHNGRHPPMATRHRLFPKLTLSRDTHSTVLPRGSASLCQQAHRHRQRHHRPGPPFGKIGCLFTCDQPITDCQSPHQSRPATSDRSVVSRKDARTAYVPASCIASIFPYVCHHSVDACQLELECQRQRRHWSCCSVSGTAHPSVPLMNIHQAGRPVISANPVACPMYSHDGLWRSSRQDRRSETILLYSLC